jgi:hypothetical protein
VVRGAGQTYGTFATVIGLLTWLYLGARIVVYAAEINVTLTRRLWPRSIMDPPEPADRKARALLAKMEERDDKQTVEVAFHPPAETPRDELHQPPYAVAPGAAERENARDAAPSVAAPDLHTLTVADLIAAIRERLDEMSADPQEAATARGWLDTAQRTLGEGARGTGANGEAHVLAVAITQTLGLAHGEVGRQRAGGGRSGDRDG